MPDGRALLAVRAASPPAPTVSLRPHPALLTQPFVSIRRLELSAFAGLEPLFLATYIASPECRIGLQVLVFHVALARIWQ
jgi:hypothetical protein